MTVVDEDGGVIGQIETVGGRWYPFVRTADKGLVRAWGDGLPPLTSAEAVEVVRSCHAALEKAGRL